MTIEKALDNKIEIVTDIVLNKVDVLLKTHESTMSVKEVIVQRVLLQKLLSMKKQFSNVQS